MADSPQQVWRDLAAWLKAKGMFDDMPDELRVRCADALNSFSMPVETWKARELLREAQALLAGEDFA